MPTLPQHGPKLALSWSPRGAVRPVFYNTCLTFYVSYLYLLKRPSEPSWGPTWAQHRPQEDPQNGPKPVARLTRGLPFSASMLEGLGRSIWDPSWGLWGPILGASGANLGPSWAILGHLGAILGPMLGLMRALKPS